LSGTSFTSIRSKNLRTWLYKIKPTVGHSKHEALDNPYPLFVSNFTDNETVVNPDQIRWKALKFPSNDSKVDFLQGTTTYCGVGSPDLKVIIKI
jgi:homogentisate 1,2-dioxygenase